MQPAGDDAQLTGGIPSEVQGALPGLAGLYDRFANALDPFSEDRDHAEQLFTKALLGLHDAAQPQGCDRRTFRQLVNVGLACFTAVVFFVVSVLAGFEGLWPILLAVSVFGALAAYTCHGVYRDFRARNAYPVEEHKNGGEPPEGDYERSLTSPENWLCQSRGLRVAADRLWEVVDSQAKSMIGAPDFDGDLSLLAEGLVEARAANMLYSLALECALKGLTLQLDRSLFKLRPGSRQQRIRFKAVGSLRGKRLHSLQELATLAGREDLRRQHGGALRLGEEFIVWLGRYPVPKNSQPLDPRDYVNLGPDPVHGGFRARVIPILDGLTRDPSA